MKKEFSGFTSENASLYLREKKVISFTAALRPAPSNRYGELIDRSSRIRLLLKDYSKGKGDSAVNAEIYIGMSHFEYLLLFFTSGRAWTSAFDLDCSTIIGDKAPDANGLVPAYHASFKRTSDGRAQPWTVSVSDGRAGTVPGRTYEEQDGTFAAERSVSARLSDLQLYGLLKKTADYIDNYRRLAADRLIPEGENSPWKVDERGKKGISAKDGADKETAKIPPVPETRPDGIPEPDAAAATDDASETDEADAGMRSDTGSLCGTQEVRQSGTMDIVVLKEFWTVDSYMVSNFACRGRKYDLYVPCDTFPKVRGPLERSFETGDVVTAEISAIGEKKKLICTGVCSDAHAGISA